MTLSQYVNSLKGKRVAVIGIGVSNAPLIRLLLSCGINVTACDKRTIEQMGMEALELINMGAKLKLGEDYLEGLDHDVIFRTPGLMPFDEHLEKAKARGSVITSEMEVFFALCPCRTIAITGSDGKTTTSTIIAELLRHAGYTVHLGGNIGNPLLCEVPEIKPEDFAVLELSSFQLHSMKCRPNVAVITNISPNHLDKHKDYQDYIDAKRAIFLEQGAGDLLVLNHDDEHTPYYQSAAKTTVAYFSDKSEISTGVMCHDGEICRVRGNERELIMHSDEIRLPGEHNLLNYLAAFAAVGEYVTNEDCREVAVHFAGVEHRLEEVRRLHGVTYINDSIGTSPSRTSAGLHAMKTKPIVIAGGYDKNIPFDTLGDDLCLMAKEVVLTGATAGKILAAIKASANYADSGIAVTVIDDFDEAVHTACAHAVEGDIVLLSPACAAFDRFKNFAERGKHFKKLIMELQ